MVCSVLGKLLAMERNCWWSGRHFHLASLGGGSDDLDLRSIVHHSEFRDKVPGEDVWVDRSSSLVVDVLSETTGRVFTVQHDGKIKGPEDESFIVLFSWSRAFQLWSETFIEQRRQCVKVGHGEFHRSLFRHEL
jgi:hypothetical protein